MFSVNIVYMFQQGKIFNNFQEKYKNLVKKEKLEQISIGKLNVVNNLKYKNYKKVEGFSGVDYVERVNNEEMSRLTQLQNKFNKDLNSYNSKYKKYLEELMSRQNSVKSRYRNKVIKRGHDIYYVNNMGIARYYNPTAWANKDNSCSEPVASLSSKEMSEIPLGTNMGVGEKCGPGGFNALDTSSGTTAWVDSLGFKHFYDDFRNRHPSCPSNTTRLTSVQFNAIPNGKTFTSSDPCNIVSLDSPLYDQLVALNNSLMRTVTAMKTEVMSLNRKDAALDKNIEIQKRKLTNTYNKLLKHKKKIIKLKGRNQTMDAETNELILDSNAVQFHHLIWMVVGATFIATAISYANKV